MRRSDLAGCDFSDARLILSDFSYCNLRGCKFVGADLSGCTFRGANLEDADFSAAKIHPVKIGEGAGRLWPTNFQRAMMQGANLRTNEVDDAIFRGADLRRARLSLFSG